MCFSSHSEVKNIRKREHDQLKSDKLNFCFLGNSSHTSVFATKRKRVEKSRIETLDIQYKALRPATRRDLCNEPPSLQRAAIPHLAGLLSILMVS